jgi:hypothetical protein
VGGDRLECVSFRTILLVLTAACTVTSTGCGGSGEEQSVALHRGALVLDAKGDAPARADIESVRVSDRSGGALRFQVGLAGQPGADTKVVVFLDTDKKKATGGGDIGADYALAASDLNEFDPEISLLHWDGETFVEADLDHSWESTVDGGVLTVDLGRVESFAPGFDLAVGTGDEDGKLDQAPDSGLWSYRMLRQVKPTVSMVGPIDTTPRTPRAGHRFAASIQLRGSAGVDVTNDTDDFTCPSTAGRGFNETISDPDAPSTATARCTWRIPPGTGGRAFRGSLNIGFRGKTLRQSVSETIMP